MCRENDSYVQLYNELSETIERLSAFLTEIEERHISPSSRYVKLGNRYHILRDCPADPVDTK